MAIPKPQSDNNSKSAPFLKAKDLPKKGKAKLSVMAFQKIAEGQFGEQIFLDVKLGAKVFTWTVKVDSGNHTRLYNRFGSNEKRWKGTIQVERDEYLGNEYVKVSD